MAQARRFTVGPDETGTVDVEALDEALFDARVFLRRLGGAVQVIAVRGEYDDAPGEFFTSHVVFEYLLTTRGKPRFEESDAPAPPADPVVPSEAELEPLPLPDPEPVVA